MQKLKMFQVDAFSSEVFRGNPAAVVPLTQWLEESQMQSIAAENNLSETAFLIPQGDDYRLRWFTPTNEVPLCGHATLASAFVILTILEPDRRLVKFDTLSGMLMVEQDGDLFIMDFPKCAPDGCAVPTVLFAGLKTKPREVLATKKDTNYYVIYDSEDEIRAIQPNLQLLEQLHPYGVVATAPSREVDFVSRYFAPSYGIPEDPVTGSIHCALVPYWASRLRKSKLHAQQLSKRGGELFCEMRQNSVMISGYAAKYLEGNIYL